MIIVLVNVASRRLASGRYNLLLKHFSWALRVTLLDRFYYTSVWHTNQYIAKAFGVLNHGLLGAYNGWFGTQRNGKRKIYKCYDVLFLFMYITSL
jgi:uncharacterized membrane protein YpjA